MNPNRSGKRVTKRTLSTFAAVPLLVWAGLAAAPASGQRMPQGLVPGDGTTDHVVVISVDGLRPDAIERYPLHTLRRLVAEGRAALAARTIFPSKTLPSHTSMVTGQPPEVHGIMWNSERAEHGNVQIPTMFEVARLEGFHTAAFFSKAKLRHLEREGAFDYWQAPASNADNWLATRTAADAVQYLQHRRPNLMFVHIGEPDYAGHTTGWMGLFYGLAVRRADGAIRSIVDAAEDAFGKGNFTVIITADHGGHENSHGSDATEDMIIPWITWGQGVVPGSAPQGVRTMDTAATALWLLGIGVPDDWVGRPVLDAYEARRVTAAVR